MRRYHRCRKTGKLLTDTGNEAYVRRGDRRIETCMHIEEQRLVQLRALEMTHGGRARADVLERAMDCLEFVLARTNSLKDVPSTLDRYQVAVAPRRSRHRYDGDYGRPKVRKRAMLIRWSRPRYRQLCALTVQLGEREGKGEVSRRVLLSRALDAMEWVVERGTPLTEIPCCAGKYAALSADNDNDDEDFGEGEPVRA